MTVLADRYELAQPLGSGGMAQVFAAYDRVLERRVAIKVINDAHLRDPAGVHRFTREARLAAGLQHPSTVAVFDVGDEDGRPFIVMELVEGRTLADRLRDEGRVPLRETVAIADAVLAGLAAAHDRGMIHRDVKPSNILLPTGGGVKLADFGIATVAGSSDLTVAGQVMGTPGYLAPERAAGQPATPASDVYAVGAIMYECLAGRPVAHAEAAGTLMSAGPLADAAPEVPADVAAVVDRALAGDPSNRFADAQAMRHALRGSSAAALNAAVPPAGGTQIASAVPADATRVMAVPRARRRVWPAVAGALGVLALVVIALNLLDGDTTGGLAGSDPDPVEEPVDEQPSLTDDAAADDREEPTEAADLTELIGLLGDNLDAAGEKGEDLLDKLRDLQAEPDSEDARKLMKDVAEWMSKGEIDAGLGEQAVALLEEKSRPEAADLADASALLADVATTTAEWADKGKDLHSRLTKLLETEAPGKQAKEARKLIAEVEKWLEEGKIDADRAEEILAVLDPLSHPG